MLPRITEEDAPEGKPMFSEIKKTSDSVYKILLRTLDENEFMVSKPNYACSIRVTGKANPIETTMWIRIAPYRNYGIAMDVNNISLEERLRGRGFFTNLVNGVIESGLVDVFVVSSASTEEIHAWCKKRGMQYDDMSLDYFELVPKV